MIETERLAFYKVTIADAPFIFELLNSPGWLKYIGDRGIKTLEDADQYIRKKILPDYDKPGIAAYAVRLKETGETLGMCGLYNRAGLVGIDIGFAFLPQYNGKGYALESARALLHHAQNNLGLKKVIAITLPENLKSINLLKKIGLSFEEMVYLPNDPEELMKFAISF